MTRGIIEPVALDFEEAVGKIVKGEERKEQDASLESRLDRVESRLDNIKGKLDDLIKYKKTD